jgi:hypothetical protein
MWWQRTQIYTFHFQSSLRETSWGMRRTIQFFFVLIWGRLQPKDVEVGEELSIVLGQHPFDFSRQRDLLLHEEKCHNKMLVHKENFQPFSLFMHKKSSELFAFLRLPYTWNNNMDNVLYMVPCFNHLEGGNKL